MSFSFKSLDEILGDITSCHTWFYTVGCKHLHIAIVLYLARNGNKKMQPQIRNQRRGAKTPSVAWIDKTSTGFAHIPMRGRSQKQSVKLHQPLHVTKWSDSWPCTAARRGKALLLLLHINITAIKPRRWHLPEWYFCRLPQCRANNKKKYALLRVDKRQKGHSCHLSPFCPLCHWWGCWSPWSCWGPECPSSHSCPLFSCRLWRPYQTKRCVWKEQAGSVAISWPRRPKSFHFPMTGRWHLGWVIHQHNLAVRWTLASCFWQFFLNVIDL